MQPGKASIVEAARECLAEILEVPIEQVAADADLRDELDVDSLQQLELTAMLEEKFGVILDADDLSEVHSIGGIAERALLRLGAPG